MKLKKITIMTMAGQTISFHVNNDPAVGFCVDSSDMFTFKKLSGNEISFVRRNVISIDLNNAESNTGDVTTE